MRLSLALLVKGKFPVFGRTVPGKIDIGKHRIVPPVTPKKKYETWMYMMWEEENMMYLRSPYLTPEQEYGHAQALGKAKKRIQELKAQRVKPLKHRLMAEHLDRLNASRAWE